MCASRPATSFLLASSSTARLHCLPLLIRTHALAFPAVGGYQADHANHLSTKSSPPPPLGVAILITAYKNWICEKELWVWPRLDPPSFSFAVNRLNHSAMADCLDTSLQLPSFSFAANWHWVSYATVNTTAKLFVPPWPSNHLHERWCRQHDAAHTPLSS